MKRRGRVWTDEQRMAASARMTAAMGKRREVAESSEAHATRTEAMAESIASPGVFVPERIEMTAERKAKLAAVQSRQWARDAAADSATREALERHNAVIGQMQNVGIATGQLPPLASISTPFVSEVPMRVPFRLTSGSNGQMVSELGACVCGAGKLVWHGICLRVRTNV
jgi:hypothetical protein